MPFLASLAERFRISGVQRVMKRAVWCSCLAIAFLCSASLLSARQVPTSTAPVSASTTAATSSGNSASSKELSDKLTALDQRVTAAQSAGDNAWMLVSSALVLMMTGPGLALFYGGLVRRKNTLAIMMQSFAMMGLITVLWALVGYSLAFGGNGPVIGDFAHAFLRGVGVDPNCGF